MSREALSLEVHHSAQSPTSRWRGVSLKWKIASGYSAIVTLLVSLIFAGVYTLTSHALKSQIEERASTIATNLADAAAGILTDKKPLELHALVTTYARLDGVAYVFIENAKRETVAHSLVTFPEELREFASADQESYPVQRVVTLKGKTVHETRVPILGGQAGHVHVGIWQDAIVDELHAAFFPLLVLLIVTLLAGIILSVLFAAKLTKPILAMRLAADKLSRGDLDTPVFVNAKDEIGDLASSLERMRASLRAAMSRLSRG